MNHRATCTLAIVAILLGLGATKWAKAEDERPPRGRALKELVNAYLDADFAERRVMLEDVDRRFAPLTPTQVKTLRKDMLKLARRRDPRIAKSGTNYLLGPERGKYIVHGKPASTLFLGLHGGGAGSGSAESAAGSMGGGGWWWLYPEVLEKTERGWTTSGTEEFVIALVRAAKRSGRVDPDRIYICGHSMGGFGSWHIGAHHADLFAGIGAYAGAPVPIWDNDADRNVIGVQPGVLPNLFTQRIHVFQSLDDPRVPPAENQGAIRFLAALQEEYGGFDVRYDEVDGRGHAAPQEGYLPSLRWLAEKKRNARPARFLWEPVLPWKRQFYWVYWERPEQEARIEVKALDGNECDIIVHAGADDLTGLSVLLGPPLFDLEKEVVIRVNGEERVRGTAAARLSTLLLTLPHVDDQLLYATRIDL